MAKRKLTEEQKQVLRDRLAKARAAKTKTQQKESPFIAEQGEDGSTNLQYKEEGQAPETNPAVPQQTISSSEYENLLKQIEELKNSQTMKLIESLQFGQNATGAMGAVVGGGRVTGTFEKYSTTKGRYPNPIERLSEEPKLARFAFPINYELGWEVGVSSYQTKEGINTKEPKFSLTLIRKVMDEETGEPTNGRYEVCRMIMHEDPEAAIVIANDNGIEVSDNNEEAFLNEMRYLRLRDWLLECFYPAPAKRNEDKTERVIGGRLVTYYEVNDESGGGPGIDWSKAPKVKY